MYRSHPYLKGFAPPFNKNCNTLGTDERKRKAQVALATRLKSSDLSIKITAVAATELLRQFVEDWAHRKGEPTSTSEYLLYEDPEC